MSVRQAGSVLQFFACLNFLHAMLYSSAELSALKNNADDIQQMKNKNKYSNFYTECQTVWILDQVPQLCGA
jgi:hypothetical protein